MNCNICGAVAKGSNYGVISCMSCKVFFQRHVSTNNSVTVNKQTFLVHYLLSFNFFRQHQNVVFLMVYVKSMKKTRKHCISCRLAACLQAGMRRKHTDYAGNRQRVEDKLRVLVEQKYKRAQLVSLDLLNADRSSLNATQWCLISNIIHTYDALFEEHKQKIVPFYLCDEQKPIKLRLKISNYQQLVATYFTFIVPFLEHIPDYQSLELSNRLTLIHHNMITLTGINSHYLASTIGFIPYFDKNYSLIMNMIYGNEIVLENENLRQKLDNTFHADIVLVKLTLVIFAFDNVTPSLSSTSQPISESINDQMRSSNILFNIQNKYVDILWRYMLFRFGHEQVVIRLFANIVYNCLHVQNFSCRVAEQNNKHKDMYETLIEQIESKLNFQDEL